MLLLFRPTFVTASLMLVLVLCTFVMTGEPEHLLSFHHRQWTQSFVVGVASASPQFGRPLLHALDEAPPAPASVGGSAAPLTASGTYVSPSATSTAGCEDQDPAPDPANVAAGPTQPATTVRVRSIRFISSTKQTNRFPCLPELVGGLDDTPTNEWRIARCGRYQRRAGAGRRGICRLRYVLNIASEIAFMDPALDPTMGFLLNPRALTDFIYSLHVTLSGLSSLLSLS
ncbi:hypothetical protein BU15DRAFT_76506 [Melanogaster broomeanus]|nr:hypothetical protein BU15DRAFT_76506 [Melanogaster broomeanus]